MEGSEEYQPQQPLTPEQRLEVIKRIQELAKAAEVNGPIAVNPDGGTDAVTTAEIMNSQNSLDMKAVQTGDVVWYRTKNGTNYLFIEGRDEHGRLKGPLENVRTDGRDNKRYDNVFFNGSTTGHGGMIKPDSIIQNMRVELILPRTEEGGELKELVSTPVEGMGIIKAGNISPTPTP